MLAKFVYLVLVTTLIIDSVAAINCNFTFIESDVSDKVEGAQTRIVTSKDSKELFNCDQDLGEEFELIDTNFATKQNWLSNRFGYQDSFELQEVSCVSSKRFITPRALNNIYNQLTPVTNSGAFVQKIQITECRAPREPCNENIYPSPLFRYICWQEYLIIKLQAHDELGMLYDENFYYPSHCSCRLVRVNKRSKKTRVIYVPIKL